MGHMLWNMEPWCALVILRQLTSEDIGTSTPD